jgi:hypothetical protein
MTGQKTERRISVMDYLAIVGGVINALVICYIVGYWLLQ